MTGPDRDVEYRASMDTVALCGRLLLGLGSHLDDCLATVAKGEILGPVLDPTGFVLGGAQNLAQARKVLEPAIRFRDACRALAPLTEGTPG